MAPSLLVRVLALLATAASLAACPGRAPVSSDAAVPFCALPGETPTGITVPPGFCVRRFATVQHARVLRFAPGGELFVASPNTPTSGYGSAGAERSRIAYIADDDHDGRGDAVVSFLPGLDSCHALLFVPGWFYYSTGSAIVRMPYTAGQRTADGQGATVVNLNDPPASFVHWPHTLDVADDGTIYVSRGGDETRCATPRSNQGAVLTLEGTHGRVVARGLRNPMYLRCQRGRGRCYANELTDDFWDETIATEKLIELHDGDDWGFPCCMQQGIAAPGIDPAPDCSGLASPTRTVRLHDTPFGMDFEAAGWPAPWSHGLFVALHGQFVTWRGARVVMVSTDTDTGRPRADVPLTDFATGWDEPTHTVGRPSDVVFAPDGRMFVANDMTGEIVWIAPVDLVPAR